MANNTNYEYPTITKGNFINQPFTIFAPESFTSNSIKATVTITSEDGITTEPIEVDILSARISLSVDEDLTQELTKFTNRNLDN